MSRKIRTDLIDNLSKATIGLSEVDNTSDANKPISVAVQAALDSKAASTVVTTTVSGLMSFSDKLKLNGIAAGATVNDTDTNLKNRNNHTGTQAISTIVGLQTILDGKASTSLVTTSSDGLLSSADKLKLNSISTGATANSMDAELRNRSTHTGTQSADTLVESATVKLFTASERDKLANIALNATANATDALLRDRGTHTGSQPISTITNLQSTLDGKESLASKGVANGYAALGADGKIPSVNLPDSGSYKGNWDADTNTPTIVAGVGSNGDNYTVNVSGTQSITGSSTSFAIGDQLRFTTNGNKWERIPNYQAVSSVAGLTGPISSGALKTALVFTKADVGLSNVDNTSDINKPISTAVQTALNGKAGTTVVTTTTAGLMSATDKTKLNSISTGATANSTDSALRDRSTHTGTQSISTIINLQNTLDAKEPILNSGTILQYYRGDKTWATLNAAAVGLNNVDNTSDINKPISTSVQTALTAANNLTTAAQAAADAAARGRSFKTISRVAGLVADYICDGTDDHVQFNEAIAALGANGGTILVRSSFNPYRFAETVTVPNNVTIIGELLTRNASYGVLIKTAAGVNLESLFAVTGAVGNLVRNVRFENIAFDGNLTTNWCVKYINADYIKHYNCRFINSTNGIFAGYDGPAAPAVSAIPGGVYLHSCNVSCRGGVGIRFEYQTQCWISDCWFTTGSTTAAWISLKCSDKVKIVNSEFNTATRCFVFEDVYTGGAYDYPCQYNTAVGCVFAHQNEMWTDTRTHPSSIRFTIIGSTSGSVTTTSDLAGTGNTVILSNYVRLPAIKTVGGVSIFGTGDVGTIGLAYGGTGATTAAAARTNLGLGNVDNTSDANKPISNAVQTALNSKASLTAPVFETSVSAPTLISTAANGNEGGEVRLARAPNGTLSGTVTVDVYLNQLRLFESGGSARGYYLDLSTGGTGSSKNILDRANHTGAQPISTISNLQSTLTDITAKLDEARSNFVVVDYFGIGLAWNDDWGPAFSAAAAAAATRGGIVYAPKRYTLITEPYIPEGVTIKGPWTQPDEMLGASRGDYDSRNGTIFIGNSGGLSDGLNVNGSCAWDGLVIIRRGLDLPFADAAAAAIGLSQFSGTAFNVAGPGATFKNLLFLGFDKAIYSNGIERTRCIGVRGDCTNGIDIRAAYDIPEIEDCQFWPYTTVHFSWTTNALLRRSGTAFYGENVNDWMRWTRCFSYGYYRGFHGRNVATVTFFLCGADNTSTGGVGDHSDAIGFVIDGSCVEPRWIACQTAAQRIGYYYANATSQHGTMAYCEAWACSEAGLSHVSGKLTATGGVLRSSPAAVGIRNESTDGGFINVQGMHFSALAVGIDNFSSTKIMRVNDCTFDSNVNIQIQNAYMPSLASAETLVPNGMDMTYLLTGTNGITSISSPQRYAGKILTFICVNGLSFFVSGNISTRSGANTAVAAGRAFSVTSDGTKWYEI